MSQNSIHGPRLHPRDPHQVVAVSPLTPRPGEKLTQQSQRVRRISHFHATEPIDPTVGQSTLHYVPDPASARSPRHETDIARSTLHNHRTAAIRTLRIG